MLVAVMQPLLCCVTLKYLLVFTAKYVFIIHPCWLIFVTLGEPVRYRIRYRDSSASPYSFKYSEADVNTVYTISGLQLGTSYVFSVQAYNKLGESDFVKNMLKATTSSKWNFLFLGELFPSFLNIRQGISPLLWCRGLSSFFYIFAIDTSKFGG